MNPGAFGMLQVFFSAMSSQKLEILLGFCAFRATPALFVGRIR
jgi:hypothetical protein